MQGEQVESIRNITNRSDQASDRLGLEELFHTAVTFCENKNFDNAESIYQTILAQDPSHLGSHFNLGLIYKMRGASQAAINHFLKVHENDTQNKEALIMLASTCKDDNKLNEAVRYFQIAQKLAPDDVSLLFELGSLFYSLDEKDKAQNAFQKLIEREPASAQAHYNLGVIFFQKGDHVNAALHYSQAFEISPDDPDTLFNLGLCYANQYDFEKAIRYYQAALSISPNDVDFLIQLGIAFQKTSDFESALDSYQKAILLNKELGEPYAHLGSIYQIYEQPEKALVHYKKAMSRGYVNESISYLIEVLSGRKPEKAPTGYVTEIFDNYASNYDKSFTQQLEYNIPHLIKEVASGFLGEKCRFSFVLDLGCGTGLVGQELVHLSNEMIGLDISPGMLAKAEKKEIYSELCETDILTYLEKIDKQFDLICAADVLNYLGTLQALFQQLANCVGNGVFIFSIEEHFGSGDSLLTLSGRYAHSHKYIQRMVDENGFVIEKDIETGIRKEKGEWVQGRIYAVVIAKKNNIFQ